jgi:metal-sulfur cluster biosynthetic enzyme
MTEETKADALAPGNGAASALPQDELARMTDDIVGALKSVYDPEIPADIYETLTTPNCPAAQDLPTMVENAVASVAGVGPVKVNVVWDPPWDQTRMSDEARATLNMW